jgi:hypothetical protein
MAKNNNRKPNGDMSKKESALPKDKKVIDKITKVEKVMIEDLLKSAFQDYSSKFNIAKVEKIDLVERITSFVSEYMSAFLIIGYDMKGQPTNIIQASNQMDADALTAAVNKFLFGMQHGNE